MRTVTTRFPQDSKNDCITNITLETSLLDELISSTQTSSTAQNVIMGWFYFNIASHELLQSLQSHCVKSPPSFDSNAQA